METIKTTEQLFKYGEQSNWVLTRIGNHDGCTFYHFITPQGNFIGVSTFKDHNYINPESWDGMT